MSRQERLLFNPCFTAFGDQILASSCIKNINRMFPEMLVDVSDRHPSGLMRLSSLLASCGARFRLVPYGNEKTVPYDHIVRHPRYWVQGRMVRGSHILSVMMDDILAVLDKSFPGVSGDLDLAGCILDSDYGTPDSPYVVVPSASTPVGPLSGPKQFHEWDGLVTLLARRWPVYELDTALNREKTYGASTGVFSAKAVNDTAKILRNALFTVCLEDGLNHWACHNGGKTYCMFRKIGNRASPEEVFYPTQTAITLYERDDAEYVFEKILAGEGVSLAPGGESVSPAAPGDAGQSRKAPFIPPLASPPL